MKVQSSITAVVPVFNEEKYLRSTFETLEKARQLTGVLFPIIFIDDASDDSTPSILKEISKSQLIQIVSRNSNGGIGAALRNGIFQVETDKFFIVPGDNDLAVEAICSLVEARDLSEMVIGFYPSQSISRPRYRILISRMYTRLINKLTNSHLPYVNCPGVYRTEYAKSISFSRSGHVFVAELSTKILHKSTTLSLIPLKTNSSTFENGDSLRIQTLKELVIFVFELLFGPSKWIRKMPEAKMIVEK
jgi:glycosyltransferase involved in cell wall biosynthesis